jgi:hypothetical protein
MRSLGVGASGSVSVQKRIACETNTDLVPTPLADLPVGGVAAVLIFFFFKTPPHAVTVKASWKEIILQMVRALCPNYM